MIARVTPLIAAFLIALAELSGCTSSAHVTASPNDAWAACVSTAHDYSRSFTYREATLDGLFVSRFTAGDWRDDLNRRVEFLLPANFVTIKHAIVTVNDAKDGAVIEVEVRRASMFSIRWHRQSEDSDRILQEILVHLAEHTSAHPAPRP